MEQKQGITIGELAEEFGVTKRILYRDLKVLEEEGYPLLSEAVEGTIYGKLEPSFKGVPRYRVMPTLAKGSLFCYCHQKNL